MTKLQEELRQAREDTDKKGKELTSNKERYSGLLNRAKQLQQSLAQQKQISEASTTEAATLKQELQQAQHELQQARQELQQAQQELQPSQQQQTQQELQQAQQELQQAREDFNNKDKEATKKYTLLLKLFKQQKVCYHLPTKSSLLQKKKRSAMIMNQTTSLL